MTDTDLLATPGVDTANPSDGRESDSGQISKMSEHTDVARSGLTGMLLPQLRALAGELGIRGTSGMRKGDLIAAIKENQAAAAGKPPRGGRSDAKGADKKNAAAQPAADAADSAAKSAPDAGAAKAETSANAAESTGKERAKSESPRGGSRNGRGRQQTLDDVAAEPAPAKSEPAKSEAASASKNEAAESAARPADSGDESGRDGGQRGRGRQRRGRDQRGDGDNRGGDARSDHKGESKSDSGDGKSDQDQGERRRDRNQSGGGQNQSGNGPARGGDDEEGGRGRRGRRFRERRRGGRDRDGGDGRDVELRDDDVLQPVAGILDVLDNYAFVRTSGYLAGQNDVYVSMNMVRKNGLRRGDAITGAVRAPREGEQGNQRQKFDPLVRLDTVNGSDVDAAKRRPEFNKLTPLYPNQRLRLETAQNPKLTTRVIDLIMPIGKGQRALIVSPPKAGKTTILQDIANAIATNNPECYLMVVLVDERPEEVTDMQRSVRGEVIASTFDRPPSDHTSVAELAIERAKRLVEMGQDVVVLLDSITRLGRAYNNSSPASGRILSGGVDSTALYPPKRFLGAARNIENGGSLTIIATAMVETGSTGDTVIFEEFKGTGNAELKLDRKIAERRVFPAVDINPSSTRHDELLMSPDEMAVVHKLRRVLSGLDSQQAIDLLIDRLKKSKNNVEFLMTVSKTAPGALDE